MTLSHAQKNAEGLLAWLTPFARRIEVAGSIRRRRPAPNDIDLVINPNTRTHTDLLGDVCGVENLAQAEIVRRAQAEGWTITRGADDGGAYLCLLAGKVQVDVWFTDEERFGTVLLCRTGSKDHNIWLAGRAKLRGGHWHPHTGLDLRGRVHARTEAEIYEALDLPFIDPVQRESAFFRTLA